LNTTERLDALLHQAEKENIRYVRFLYCDNAGIIRGKGVPIETLGMRARAGVGIVSAMQAVTVMDDVAVVPEMGPVGEFRLIPDLDSFVLLPLPGVAMLLCDLLTPTLEQAWAACPRSFLKRMHGQLEAEGLQVQVGTEHEFVLALEHQDEQRYRPADEGPLFGSDGLNIHANFVNRLLECVSQPPHLSPELIHTEYGPGQIEFSTRAVEVLRAADNVCRVREIVRSLASQYGLVASFAPKPFVEQMAGNGLHLHISLWDRNNTNVFYDGQATHGLSRLGRYFIGGLLHHLPGLLALTCASVNSYDRLKPHSWSSAFVGWGFENREAAVRVPSLLSGRESASLNLELKCSDHSGNPYLALGALLVAGVDGMRNQMEPGEPLQIDPGHLSDEERQQQGIQRLPFTLAAALDELERDSVLMEALGTGLSTSYLAVKRAEIAGFQGMKPEEIASAIFTKY
jgi:glutamine synthetase